MTAPINGHHCHRELNQNNHGGSWGAEWLGGGIQPHVAARCVAGLSTTHATGNKETRTWVFSQPVERGTLSLNSKFARPAARRPRPGPAWPFSPRPRAPVRIRPRTSATTASANRRPCHRPPPCWPSALPSTAGGRARRSRRR